MLVKPTKKYQKLLVPEVIQTSMMDCGPATLKSVLEGFGISANYGRLREVCQTSIDGTSIGTIEQVANQLGLDAEQILIPIDHIFLNQANALPAILVVKRPDGAAHFVVVWSKLGQWLQIMDPGVGRRWVKIKEFKHEIFHHSMLVSETDWTTWAATKEFLDPLVERLKILDLKKSELETLISNAISKSEWFGIAALDASTRFVTHLVNAGGIKLGNNSTKLLKKFLELLDSQRQSPFDIIPAIYWSAYPGKLTDIDAIDSSSLQIQGCVLIRLSRSLKSDTKIDVAENEISDELSQVLNKTSENPFKTVWAFLREDGLLAPVSLGLAVFVSAGIVLIQMLLFKGIFDVGWALNLPVQRISATFALLVFLTILLMIEFPIGLESMRMGRNLEARLRLALLEKLPQLSDRYFQSRPISDMAERSHSIYLARLIPGLGLHLLQSFSGIIFTLIGLSIIDPNSFNFGLSIILISIVCTIIFQSVLNERDLRVRSQVGAMNSFYLDALIGAVPITTHQAQKVVIREHESLLVSWARSSVSLLKISIFVEGILSIITTSLAGYLIYTHFLRVNSVNGSDLLLIFWALRLPAISHEFTLLSHQYPAQRNMLLRLIEPLSTPVEEVSESKVLVSNKSVDEALALSVQNNELLLQIINRKNDKSQIISDNKNQVFIEVDAGCVVVAGNTVLEDINLTIRKGEHIAIVGSSGAGKSTLIGLLLGWYRLSQGTLLVDGKPYNREEQELLRPDIAWVDPTIQLWNRTFLSNITYSVGDDFDSSIHNSIEAANLKKVIENLPEGLQTYLGEGGAVLSGGEGQRVRLARSLMQKNVKLALLDEPFRGLDRDQRANLLENSQRWWKNVTLLCVTHDVSETLKFDRVLVVENGRIIEDGNPLALVLEESRYKDLLDTEKYVREEMWKSADWRKIKIENGQLTQNLSNVEFTKTKEDSNVD